MYCAIVKHIQKIICLNFRTENKIKKDDNSLTTAL